jgi:hypothetical protein
MRNRFPPDPFIAHRCACRHREARASLTAHRPSFLLRPLCLLAILGSLSLRFAQTGPNGPAEPLSQSPVFKYYVWGQVRLPGAYRLSANPDIVELLSAGGGPTEQADLSHVVLVRAIDQRRQAVDLRQSLAAGRAIPLSPGDVVMVPRSLWYSIRDELAVVTTLAIFVNLYFTIANQVRR